MKRVKSVFVLLGLFLITSCQKEDCSCYEVMKVSEPFSYVWARNSCTKQITEYYVPKQDFWKYSTGEILCGDSNFY